MASSACARFKPGRLLEHRLACQGLRAAICMSVHPSMTPIRESTSTANYWTYHNSRFPAVQTPEAARDIVALLSSRQRRLLLVELDRYREHSDDSDELRGNSRHVAVPDRATLAKVMMANFIPFIGFGFLDNAIMILAGESIEVSLGAVFCISTMAAAALGNLVSDVAGMGLASGVETVAVSMGLSMPKLTSEQMMLRPVRTAVYSGRTIGLTIGCIVGMFPLLFIGRRRKEAESTDLPCAVDSS